MITSWAELMLWPTVSRSVRLGVGHPFGAYDQILLFPFFCRKIVLLFVLGRPLWQEDGSIIYSAICKWSESRRTHNHTLLPHLRLLGSLPIASYGSRGLRWKYSNPLLQEDHIQCCGGWSNRVPPRCKLSLLFLPSSSVKRQGAPSRKPMNTFQNFTMINERQS
jgi:hypothetical protein